MDRRSAGAFATAGVLCGLAIAGAWTGTVDEFPPGHFHQVTTPMPITATYSVFRLAARCTDLCGWIPRMECAPVSEKRVGLNRSPRRQGYGR
jgi:hypothetical protein